LIDLVIENLEPHVGNANIVNVGEDERDPGLDRLPIFVSAVELAADIATRFLYL
jgi:hypothetical protein